MKNFLTYREEKIKEREKRGKALKSKIIEVLVNNFDVKRIYLFGSLPEGRFEFDSDIDVACEGIPNEAFLRASALLDSLSSEFDLELVELNHVSPLLRKRILEKGELIYEGT